MAIKIRAKPDFANGPVVLQRIPADAVSPKDAARMNPSRVERDLVARQKAATIKAPGVLPEMAQETWRSAFDEGFQGSCKAKKQNDQREACAAAYAWGVVKESFRKDEQGNWIERTFAETNREIGSIPLPDELRKSPVSVAMIWAAAYAENLLVSKSIADAASHAWLKLHTLCDRGAEGTWTKRIATDEPASPAEAAEAEMAEPVIERSLDAGVTYRSESGPVIVDGISPEDYPAVIERYGNEWAARPENWLWQDWVNLPYERKTVAAVLRHIMECRAYSQAANRLSMKGWFGEGHPNGSGEVIFRGWANVGTSNQAFVYAVLICRKDQGLSPDDWIVSIHRDTPLIARTAPGMRRFRGPMIHGS